MALLEVHNVSKQYGKLTAVQRISFFIEEGRCVSLLGPNGAGKTTTLKMLTGLAAPSEGTVRFPEYEGKDIREWIGFLPQYPAFYKWMSAREFLEYAGKLTHMTGKKLRQRVEEVLTIVGLTEAAKRRIGGFSGGMKQRLGIAQAMIHRPKLLILDEPVSALDPLGRREVLELIREIKRETTVLFSTHVLHDAEEISDDIMIMRRGEISLSGSLEQIRQDYQQPLLIVEADVFLEDWAASLTRYPFIDSVDCHHDTAKVTVTDLAQAKMAVLADLVERRIPVRRFEVARTTLEDLFVKAVNS
ncbi:ABC transporter ATP-binding protein [Paenibacillus sp. J2TS4]|uniref:ABC transporter ATP-binding protein n=1 Tax=Paenibacillus sp. J2TS4 TaxID=2807194 RepID=UPI001B243A3A|nr:ABC transporter ATP-binding protein [Paenibacillus sp. J2TS4]GIP35449.1 putative ABC transporter ATP-binding protein YxlF [Paenibacillus sp. J2TS4]